LTASKTENSEKNSQVAQPSAPIMGRSELQNAETKGGQQEGRARLYECANKTCKAVKRSLNILQKDFRRRLYRAPFVIEVLGILVLYAYTRAAYQANHLTRLALIGSSAAVLSVDFNSDLEERAVMMVVTNRGQLNATKVRGTITIKRETPNRQILHKNRYTIGDAGEIIIPSWKNSEFQLQRRLMLGGLTDAERLAIQGGQEFVQVMGEIRYDDGVDEMVVRSFCRMVMGRATTFNFLDCDQAEENLSAEQKENTGLSQPP
jgi:hypothetical protein